VHSCSRRQSTPRPECFNQDQEASALGAPGSITSLGRFFDSWRLSRDGGFDGAGIESCADSGAQVTVPRAQEAVISHVDESVR